jgi:hypothetical protein
MPGAINPIDIHVGRGDIWIGVTPPATPPVPLVGGLPADGRFIGATLAPATFTYRTSTYDIKTQQDTGIVGYVITEEEPRLEFEIGEITYENLRDFLLGAFGHGTYITFGSLVCPPTFSVLLIAPKRTTGCLPGTGAFIEVMLYAAIFGEDRAFPFARESWTNAHIVARPLSTLTRQQGDRQGFFHPHVVSS